MEAFYASVEQRDNPQLRGKPVIVAWRGKRSVVCAASYEARAFDVHSAMPAMQAERLCLDAIFLAPDFTRFRVVSGSVHEIFARHTDIIEPLSLDEAYLDVRENKTGLPTATLLARSIRKQIRQELNLTASAGVAPNKFLAKLASHGRKPDDLFVIQPEDVDSFLLPLSKQIFCSAALRNRAHWYGLAAAVTISPEQAETKRRQAMRLNPKPCRREHSMDKTLADSFPARIRLQRYLTHAKMRIRLPA